MSSAITPVPPGHHTVTPHLVIRNANAAVEFYEKAFGATVIMKMNMPGSDALMHGEIRIGNSMVMIAEESPKWGSQSPLTLKGTPVALGLYVDNCDASYDRAIKAGATSQMAPADMFWGDRFAKVSDPFGHEWTIATHVRDVSPEECEAAAKRMFSNPAGECCPGKTA